MFVWFLDFLTGVFLFGFSRANTSGIKVDSLSVISSTSTTTISLESNTISSSNKSSLGTSTSDNDASSS